MSIFFPVVLVFGSILKGGCAEIQNAISSYYYTNMRDLFVGWICLVSMLLMSYKGYGRIDQVLSITAGVFALGVAFFPTSIRPPFTACVSEGINQGVRGVIHLVSAAGFLITLAYLSYFQFTKSRRWTTPRKRIRNLIYQVCAIIMVASTILIAFYMITWKFTFPALQGLKPIFWLETIALFAFGFSWLVKGEIILKDRKRPTFDLMKGILQTLIRPFKKAKKLSVFRETIKKPIRAK
ncbi:DUF998 domain-containing protein [Marinoscillum sp. MHG1-6]|uniref:DUF998 domain-containing protein n=1 Tax=Marinoscillum sp. MHG1-6 TaxID=2959627 RepID=UPI002157FA76|nr:DUF998 domain-containing protein [Marinoscillum sp. MHG1-6]